MSLWRGEKKKMSLEYIVTKNFDIFFQMLLVPLDGVMLHLLSCVQTLLRGCQEHPSDSLFQSLMDPYPAAH